MKNFLLIMVVIFLTIFLAHLDSFASKQNFDLSVEGQNNPEKDLKAAQEAIDKGGSILLKGVFNFGEKGQVIIKNDVEIMGETDSEGKLLTIIKGGKNCFHAPLPTGGLPLKAQGPKISIHSIHFDGALFTPIHLAYTSGAKIEGNNITNVKPYNTGYAPWHAGAVVGTHFMTGTGIIQGAVTGNLTFKKNRVDLLTDKPKETLGQGIYCQLTWGATIKISENTFTNVCRNSIECLDNSIDGEGRGRIIITKNKIITPVEGSPLPSPSNYPNGVVVGWYHDMSGGADPSRNSKILIMDNDIEMNGERACAIMSLADETIILENKIHMKGGAESKAILQLGSNGFIARNKIEGSGKWAIREVPYGVFKGSGNTFAWNDFREFNALAADAIFLGNKNTIVGEKCKVDDQGKENVILIEN